MTDRALDKLRDVGVVESARPPLPRKDFPAYVRVKSKTNVRIALRRPDTATREFGLDAFDASNVWSKQFLDKVPSLAPGMYKTRVGWSNNKPVVVADLKKITAKQEIDRLTKAMKKRKGRFTTRAPGVRGEKEKEHRIRRMQDRTRETTDFLVHWLKLHEGEGPRGSFQVGMGNPGGQSAPDAASMTGTDARAAVHVANMEPNGDPTKLKTPKLTKLVGSPHPLAEGVLDKPHKCKYCYAQATKALIWADGRAFVPVCPKCESRARHRIVSVNHDSVAEVRPLPGVKESVDDPLFEAFEYPQAGRNAPLDVRRAIKKFRAQSDTAKAKTPLLYWLLGAGTPPYKMSKADSQYTDRSTTPDQTCGNCEFLYRHVPSNTFICSQIRGRVKRAGWCNRWRAVERRESVDEGKKLTVWVGPNPLRVDGRVQSSAWVLVAAPTRAKAVEYVNAAGAHMFSPHRLKTYFHRTRNVEDLRMARAPGVWWKDGYTAPKWEKRWSPSTDEGTFARGYSPGHVGRDEFLRDPFLALYGEYNAQGAGTFSKASGHRPRAGKVGKSYQPTGEPTFKTAHAGSVIDVGMAQEASAAGTGTPGAAQRDPNLIHDPDAQEIARQERPKPDVNGVYPVPATLWPLLTRVRRNGQSLARTTSGELVPVKPEHGLTHRQSVFAAQFFKLKEDVYEAYVNGTPRLLTPFGVVALFEAVDHSDLDAWLTTFVTPVAEADTTMLRQQPTASTAQTLVGLAGVVNRCGNDGVCHYQPETGRARLQVPSVRKTKGVSTSLMRQMLAVPGVKSAEVAFSGDADNTPIPRGHQGGPVDLGYRKRTRRHPPLLPSTSQDDVPVRLGAWVAGYDESRGYELRPALDDAVVLNPVDHLEMERYAKRVAQAITTGDRTALRRWWVRGGGFPVSEAQGLAALRLAKVAHAGKRFVTGAPVTFEFLRNTKSSPNRGSRFGQDIEPAGRYMIQREPGAVPQAGWKAGTVTFKNPLVLYWVGYGADGWKARLSKHYDGKTGKALSRAVRQAGYDGIVTVTKLGGQWQTGEIVDLTGIREDVSEAVDTLSEAADPVSFEDCCGQYLAEGDTLDEAKVSMEDMRKYLVPRKSVVIGGKWWTVTQRDLKNDVVQMKLADWEKGSGTRTVKISKILSNVNSGKWGMSILDKGHIGADSPRFGAREKRKKEKEAAEKQAKKESVDDASRGERAPYSHPLRAVLPGEQAFADFAEVASALDVRPVVSGTVQAAGTTRVRADVERVDTFEVLREVVSALGGMNLTPVAPIPVFIPEEIHRPNPFPDGSDGYYLYHTLMQAVRRGEVEPTRAAMQQWVQSHREASPKDKTLTAASAVIDQLTKEKVIEHALAEATRGRFAVGKAFSAEGHRFQPGDRVRVTQHQDGRVAVHHTTTTTDKGTFTLRDTEWAQWKADGRITARADRRGPTNVRLRRKIAQQHRSPTVPASAQQSAPPMAGSGGLGPGAKGVPA